MNNECHIFSAMFVENNSSSKVEIRGILTSDEFRMKEKRDFFFVDSEKNAIRAYRELYYRNQAPDLVFLATGREELDSYRVLDRIHDINPYVFAVIISEEATQENILESRIAGANGFIVRPVTADIINQYIQRYFEKKIERAARKFKAEKSM